MKFLFATGRSHLPEQVAGAERCADTLLHRLIQAGHECEAVASLRSRWRRRIACARGFLSPRRGRCFSDLRQGYRCYRAASRKAVLDAVVGRIAAFRPDVVVTQLERSDEIAEVGLRKGIPVVLMVHDAELHSWKWPRPHPLLKLVSNSDFVARRLREDLGLDSLVIHPMIDLSDYAVASTVPEHVTFVNPIPEKGLDLALEIAAMVPDRQFVFVESWRLSRAKIARLRKLLQATPHVRFSRWTPGMRAVYARTAVLIVPSQWNEAFGRVALEAQVSGIPVLARDTGGLGETLRDSGVLFPKDASPRDWADEIQRLLSDSRLYALRAQQAKANAARPEFGAEYQMAQFFSLARRF